MVDFQSRDTSRGYGDDEDDEEQGDSAADGSAEGTGEQEGDESTQEVGEQTGDESAQEVGEPESDTADETDDPPADAASPESSPDPESGDPDTAEPSSDPLAPSGSAGAAESDPDASGESDTDPLAPGGPDGETPRAADDADPLADSGGSSTEQTASGEHAKPPSRESAEPENGRTAGESRPEDRHSTGHSDPDEHGHDGSHGAGGSHGDGRHGDSDVHSHEDDHSHGDGRDHGHTHAADVDLLGVAVVTVSSTRTADDDPSGDVIEAVVEAADHEVVTREILRDDLDGVQNALLRLTGRDDVDVVVTTGGTGVTPDDVTVEAARPLFDRELPGFGELFRILSYEEIGTRAMASRATAGMVEGVAVFCLPGSEAAARLGTEELVVEEMGHLVGLARRDD